MHKFSYNRKLNEALPSILDNSENIKTFYPKKTNYNSISFFILLNDSFMQSGLNEWHILPDESSYLILHVFENKSFSPRLLFVGPRSKTKIINRKNRNKTLIAVLKPGIFKTLFNIPAYLFKNDSIPAEVLLGDEILEIIEKSIHNINNNDLQKAINVIDNFISTNTINRSNFIKNCNLIHRIKTDINLNTAARISSYTGYSERYLRKIMNDILGLSPKEVLKVKRLKNTLTRVSQEQNFSWTDISLSSGFYDQSHMINEFQELIGLTLRNFVKHYSM